LALALAFGFVLLLLDFEASFSFFDSLPFLIFFDFCDFFGSDFFTSVGSGAFVLGLDLLFFYSTLTGGVAFFFF